MRGMERQAATSSSWCTPELFTSMVNVNPTSLTFDVLDACGCERVASGACQSDTADESDRLESSLRLAVAWPFACLQRLRRQRDLYRYLTPSRACRPAPDGIFDVTGNGAPYMTFSCAPTQVVVGGNPLGALCCNDYVAAQINAPAGITLTDATSLGNVELNKGSGWAADSFFNGGELSYGAGADETVTDPPFSSSYWGFELDLPQRGKLHRRRRCCSSVPLR